MRKVLVVAWYFPPWGGAGVQRTVKHVKYLPLFGWQPVILTGPMPRAGLSDPTLAKDLDQASVVRRTHALLPPAVLPWRVRHALTRWLLVSDEQAGWYPFALAAASDLIKSGSIDAVYTTSTPYTAHLTGLRLKQRFDLPWIADFRDPWADNAAIRPPTAWHRRRIGRWEQQVINTADRVTVVSDPMAQALRAAYPHVGAQRFLSLPNGYDPDDFAHTEPAGRQPGRMGIVYSGSFYGQRSSQPFLQALRNVLDRGDLPRSAIHVRLVGNVGQATTDQVRALELGDVVEATGYVAHRQSVAYVLGADVLLLMIAPGPESAGVLTGKIFEYLAARRPVLAVTPPSAAADLIRESRAGVVVDPDDGAAIERLLVEWHGQWQRGELNCASDTGVVERFDRRRLTQALAQALDHAAAGKPLPAMS